MINTKQVIIHNFYTVAFCIITNDFGDNPNDDEFENYKSITWNINITISENITPNLMGIPSPV